MSIVLLIPEGEGQDLFPPVPPIPSFPALGRLEYTTGKGGGGAYPLFIIVIHSTECSEVAVVAGGK